MVLMLQLTCTNLVVGLQLTLIKLVVDYRLLNLMFFWPCIIVLTFSNYQHNAHFLHSLTIYMLHYNPQHVSSSTLLIFRRTNCIITASGIVTVCKRSYSMPVESGLQNIIRIYHDARSSECQSTLVSLGIAVKA